MTNLSRPNPECPLLPAVSRDHTARDVSAFGKDRGPAFYQTTLCYAQTLWTTGFPAQALLQINRSMSADLKPEDEVLTARPIAYSAVAWIIVNRPEGQFLGNPRRHYQHLATRMVEPRKTLREWRAWACWYIAKTLLPEAEFPADTEQIEKESLILPSPSEIATGLDRHGLPRETELWHAALRDYS